MTKPRVPETDSGIQGEFTVKIYDQMQRHLRDMGWIETREILAAGITAGHVLEIGHGPGYLGLEWLKNTSATTLTGLDISPDMQSLARHNAQAYGFSQRTIYYLGNADDLPFKDNIFDAVFTNGSLHEWENPLGVFNEIYRVLKPGGKYFISDMRRDMSVLMRAFLWLSSKPAAIRPGLVTSINAAYTPAELKSLVAQTHLKDGHITNNLIGITVTGRKDSSI